MRIDTIHARTIPDTRGRPTIETTLTAGDLTATASVPSGKSTGSHEAIELRDPDGGVARAIENVNGEIARSLAGCDFASPDELDTFLIELDGTPNKSRLGANAILSLSIATMRLFALSAGVPLWKAIAERSNSTSGPPRLYVNVMNGGVHADFKLPFQEYMLVVEGNTSEALPVAQKAFMKLGEMLGSETPMGDEGGYAPTFDTLERPFELLSSLVAEYPGTFIAIDAAASELCRDGVYELLGKTYTPEELFRVYEDLVARFPLKSIEDPFSEDATADFARLTAAVGKKVLIVGDDFTVTNPARIDAARDAHAINAVLIKPNQIGSVKETIEAVRSTREAGWEPICSHRSGETDDTFIADFAYGIGAYGIKAGGLGQKERLEKYERLVMIEREAKTV
jgi:enolase